MKFNDYTMAFDRVLHDEIITKLTKLKIDGKDLQVIKNMYWERTAAIRVDAGISLFYCFKKIVWHQTRMFAFPRPFLSLH